MQTLEQWLAVTKQEEIASANASARLQREQVDVPAGFTGETFAQTTSYHFPLWLHIRVQDCQ
jgi:hypothetical protein